MTGAPIVLEPLYKRGSNLLNTVAEGIGYVDEINHPRLRLLADFDHMLCECGWPKQDVAAAWRGAVAVMHQQSGM